VGERLVTSGLDALHPDEARAARVRVLAPADGLIASAHILATARFLAGQTASTGMSGLLVNPRELRGHAGAPMTEFA
jgi:hypothetical protein